MEKTLIPLLPSKEDIDQLKANWRTCLPINIGDLFIYEIGTTLRRYDTFPLSSDFLSFIINELNSASPINENNIKLLSIAMGKGEVEGSASLHAAGPTDNVFCPILEITLHEAYEGKKFYSFPLSPVIPSFQLKLKNKVVPIAAANTTDYASSQISPNVAELFILKWQSLNDTEVNDAFEGLAPSIARIVEDDLGEPIVTFGGQKNQRVRSYGYEESETVGIINTIKAFFIEGKKVEFVLHMGAGLKFEDFHPFFFRPIIAIKASEVSIDIEAEEIVYFDTSKPCPPFCPKGD